MMLLGADLGQGQGTAKTFRGFAVALEALLQFADDGVQKVM